MFGKRLAELRNQKGLSQYKLADILNLTRGQIGNYEQGKREPDLKTLQLFANFFDVTVDYLIGHTDSKNNDKPDLERPFRAKTLADAILDISSLYFEYNLNKETFHLLMDKAVQKYGIPEPVEATEPAAHGPNVPGTGAMEDEGDSE